MKTATQTQITGHWKKLYDPNYLGSWDLENGDLILTVSEVKKEEMFNQTSGKKEQNPVVVFKEKGYKPLVLNATNSATIAKVLQTPYVEEWQGQKIQLFKTQVRAFGQTVDAIRVRDFKPKPKKTLTEERFLKMLISIREGKFEKIKAYNFDLTEDQRKELENL